VTAGAALPLLEVPTAAVLARLAKEDACDPREEAKEPASLVKEPNPEVAVENAPPAAPVALFG
jgi:hypothetical protein